MKKLCRLLLPGALLLLLTGCLFRPPADLYKPPEAPQDYAQLKAAISEVRSGLEAEFQTTPDAASIVSGDNTATIQLQDLDGDGLRESAVTFFKVPGIERPLKIYIFSQVGEDYAVTGLVEGDGAAIYSVDYVDLNGSGSRELVVCWQISTGVYQLGAYTLDELDGVQKVTVTGSADRSTLLATQMLLTSCSMVTDGSNVSGGYCLLDFDQDTRTEIAVARIDSSGLGGLVEVYGWQEGSFDSLGSVGLSSGIVSLNRIRSNCLKGELYPPALYITGTLDGGSRVIDVTAYQRVEGKTEKQLVNLSLDRETGVSRELLQGYTDAAPTDINEDYVLEVPSPTALPSFGDAPAANFWLIDWNQYDADGGRTQVMTTYHNQSDGWYLELPEDWRDRITISRNDQVSGQREVIFSLWLGPDESPQPFLSIYRLTGNNRAAALARGGYFVLREEESAIYAARFYTCSWSCGLDETSLRDRFKTIQTGWYYE